MPALDGGAYLNVELERAFLPRWSAFVSLGGWSNRWNASASDGGTGSLEVGARFFPGQEAPRGFFIGTFVAATASSWDMGTGTSTGPNGEVTTLSNAWQRSLLGLGGMLGYTWIPWKRLVLSLGAGGTWSLIGQYQFLAEESQPQPLRFEFTTSTLLPSLRAAVGFAF